MHDSFTELAVLECQYSVYIFRDNFFGFVAKRWNQFKRLIKLKLIPTSNIILNSEQTTISLLRTIAQSFSRVASEFQAHNSKIFVLLLRAKHLSFVWNFQIQQSNEVSVYSSSMLS